MAHERFPARAASFLTDIEIIEVGRDDWQLKVFGALNAGIQPRLSSNAINRILQLVEKELHCKSVVVEPYHSTDFADEYSGVGFSELLTLDGNLVQWCIFPEPPRVNLRRSDILALLSQWLPMIVDLKNWLTVTPT